MTEQLWIYATRVFVLDALDNTDNWMRYLDIELNAMGDKGWELVGTTSHASGRVVAFFKMPAPPKAWE
jgi:hypothetical protein